MSAAKLLPVGDRGRLLELDDNRAALAVAARLRAELPGLVDVVPGHRTVLAVGDVDDHALLAAAADALAEQDERREATSFEISVLYDGADLAEVARLLGLDADEVVARHAAPTYTVAFLGFAPGFAYLLGGDPGLEVPRLADPRERVPAGSVAIAGPYSCIYPRSSPGGWRLLGRTELRLFDAERLPPALLAPGDRVRFVPL